MKKTYQERQGWRAIHCIMERLHDGFWAAQSYRNPKAHSPELVKWYADGYNFLLELETRA